MLDTVRECKNAEITAHYRARVECWVDVYDIRRRNLKRLMTELAVTRNEFAASVGTNAAYLSQIIHGVTKTTGKKAAMGHALARKIEGALDLAEGYMDQDHDTIRDAATDVLVARITIAVARHCTHHWPDMTDDDIARIARFFIDDARERGDASVPTQSQIDRLARTIT